MPYFKTKTCDYYYDQKGHGKTIIFAHGLFVDRNIFSYQFDFFNKEYNCISFDLPGHSKSSCFNENGWTLDDIADDIAYFIRENLDTKPLLIGQSQGGMVFMRLAVRYPELLSGLILIGTSSKAEYKERIPFWKKTISILNWENQDHINSLLETIQQNVVSNHFFESNPSSAKEELRIMKSHKPLGLKLATEAAVLRRSEYSKEIEHIHCNTLIVSGEEDQATPPDVSEMMAKRIKKSQLKFIPNTSHHIPIEAPKELAGLISRFMKETGF